MTRKQFFATLTSVLGSIGLPAQAEEVKPGALHEAPDGGGIAGAWERGQVRIESGRRLNRFGVLTDGELKRLRRDIAQ